jgi:ATP-dependent Lhr-like helicase
MTTMSSPTSGSEGAATSNAFPRLHPQLQRWVHEQGWTSLHDAQERAIGPILDGDRDVIISAATAAGKTEAAFLPICSALASAAEAAQGPPPDPWLQHDPWAETNEPARAGIQVLYVSPLKALINDQYDRLELLCERAGIDVHRWHGDVSASAKQKVRRNPSGVLLITPESLEATFVNRGSALPSFFAGLRYIVIDELHSFLATARGAQLQSLLNRVDLAVRRRAPRIGLSATLGDMSAAAAFLRPTKPDDVLVIDSSSDAQHLKLQVRGYRHTAPELSRKQVDAVEGAGGEVDLEQTLSGDRLAIAEHLFRSLRGSDNLVFANSRRDVELFADLLARRCESEHLPNEFWPHHGSLAKDVREIVEAQLKDRSRPVTAVCTSTLEMGIDIGTVASVAQVGPPPSVASLRQRLGRSGRRGEAAVVRVYVAEEEITGQTSPIDELRPDIVQTVAMVRLLLAHWVEPPDDPGLNLSTLIQQVLSVIAQHGGATAKELHGALCGPGPFELVNANRFARLLRAMAAADLIVQTDEGTLLHGLVGERAVNHYSFYTAFQTPEEWKLVADGRSLGTLPIVQPLIEGGLLIFGGRRWKITNVDSTARVVELTRSSGGVPPNFGGDAALVGNRVRDEMVAVYRDTEVPGWLDAEARALLGEGRDAWKRYDLDHRAVIEAGKGCIIVPWVGDRALVTVALQLGLLDVEAGKRGPALELPKHTASELRELAAALVAQGAPDPMDIARRLSNTELDKWDWVLDGELAAEATTSRLLDVPGAWSVLERVGTTPPSDEGEEGAGAPRTLTGPAEPSGHPDRPGTMQPPMRDVSAEIGGAAVADVARRRTLRDAAESEFCVIDVETTGFSPRLGDRVVEVAAVRINGYGAVLDEWSTLVNPGRDIGATHVHGITAGDVLDAPPFSEIAGDLLARLDGAVFVAHNLRFDWGFVSSEFARAGAELPAWPGICTLALGGVVQRSVPSRKLGACCAQLGIEMPAAHDALGDAQAAAALLARYLQAGRLRDLHSLEDLGCRPLSWPPAPPQFAPSGRRQARGAGQARLSDQGSYLGRLVDQLDGAGLADPDVGAYLDLLDRALEDRRLTDAEASALQQTASEWGLDAQAVRGAHRMYFDALVAAALADGVVSASERADLDDVAALLAVPASEVAEILAAQRAPTTGSATSRIDDLEGASVCFTGALVATKDGVPITRAQAQSFATDAGLVVKTGVSKGLDLLVVADPDSQSGKAVKARQLGTRVIAEAVFWRLISAPVD